MRKYNVDEKALKMKMRKREPAHAADHLEVRLAELQADRCATEIFILGIAISDSVHGKL
jgi:hypothetical protein